MNVSRLGVPEWLAAGRAIFAGNLLRHDGKLQLTRKFEERLEAHLGVRHALTLTSGTTALTAALAVAGVGPGDEVLVPAYTWMATASAPIQVGAVPVMVEINETLTIDPLDIERKITPYTRAIVPVHMVNAPCDMDAILEIARRHNLIVIEDAAQAAGVRYKDRYCGTIGDIGALSFNHHKNMNIGEGGAALTNDARLFARLLNYHDVGVWARDYGIETSEPYFVGTNARVTELQGAMLNVQLDRLKRAMPKLAASRRAVAEVLERQGWPRLSPHNDPASAVTLTVIFDTEAEAIAFAGRPGAYRLFDNSKHVYSNWEPILAKRVLNPKLDPWAWAHRQIDYSADMCPKTLDILRRTCRIYLSERAPAFLTRPLAARRFAQPAALTAAASLQTRRARDPAAGIATNAGGSTG